MSSKQRDKQLKVLGQTKLTEEQRTLIAQNLDTPFFKLISEVILPSRVNRLSLTAVSAAATLEDLWFYKGRVAEAEWLGGYLTKQAENIDDVDFSNDSENDIEAQDDDPES